MSSEATFAYGGSFQDPVFTRELMSNTVKRTVCFFQVNDVCTDTLSLVIMKKSRFSLQDSAESEAGCVNMHPTHLGVHDELRLKPYFM